MFSALIVAAGSANRAGLGYNKMFYKIKDKTILEYSIDHFLHDSDFSEIIIVLSKEDITQVKSMFSNPKIKYVLGGSTRQKSVFNGLNLVNESFVFIHDGARPNLKREDLIKLKHLTRNERAISLYSNAKDSIISILDDKIDHYLDRDNIGLMQTPQVFNTQEIKKAHSLALNSKKVYTDDASVYMNELGKKVTLVLGSEENIKATTKMDLIILEELL